MNPSLIGFGRSCGCVKGNCFPIDTRVKKQLDAYGLPQDERWLVRCWLGSELNPHYLARNPGGEWQLLSFSAKPTAQGSSELYQLALAQAMPHSRSVSSGQTLNERHPVQQEVFIEGLGRLHFDIIKQPGRPRFTITTTVQHVRADGSPLPAAQADGVAPGQ